MVKNFLKTLLETKKKTYNGGLHEGVETSLPSYKGSGDYILLI